MKDLWGRLQAAFDDLSIRERILVSLVGGLLVFAVIYFGVVQATLEMRNDAEQRLSNAQRQLDVMSRLRREFDDVNGRLTRVEARIQTGPRGNLRTTLENLAQASMVKVESMEPQASPSNDNYRETKVEVGLKDVTLFQTAYYLHQIEAAAQVFSVKSLRMRIRKDKPELLDVTFTVSSFEPI
ncbi:MAG: type II secretion system protein GspM [Myxococcota bacterium]